jgi:acetylornithine/N-succinyldiaminopimelate aminotransferase
MATKKTSAKHKVSAAQVRSDEAKHLMNTYKRPEVLFTHGRGARLYDSDGKEYLDFLGGIAVNALGYSHPRLVQVIRREAGRAIHLSNLFHNPFQGPLAKKLAQWSGLDRVFFTNSGTEAVDGALKLARAYSNGKASGKSVNPKTRILATVNSFHGRTFGALSITYPEKYRAPFEPLVPGIDFVKFNDVADLESKFDSSVCAFIVETIQGEGGVYPVSAEFWNRARALANQHDAAFIADEIQCGMGRTGRHFAYEKFDSRPDIVTLAKPLAGGLPLGAFIANEKLASAFVPGLHGTTFGGGPLVCAAALEFMNVVESEKLLTNIRERSAEIRKGLEALAAKFDFIKEVRGEGLILGIDLAIEGGPLVSDALASGLLINCTHEHVLRLLPPFIIRKRDVNEFLHKFEKVLENAAKSITKASATPTKEKTATQRQPVALAASR